MSKKPLISLKNITRWYPSGDEITTVLHNVSLNISRGEMVAIIGASGSGKSTLMNILGCLDKPSAGTYSISGRQTSALNPDELAQLRREHFGFIFQRYHLLGELDAIGNVEIPAIYAGQSRDARRRAAMSILNRLGMGKRTHHRPNQLSGGQQQRVSIARALINGADVILADEPTGALDSHSGEEVLGILDELNKEGHTIIIVTHDRKVAARAKRIIEICDGEIISDEVTPNTARKKAIPLDSNLQLQNSPVFTSNWRDRFQAAALMALRAMNAHRMRTFLTMLGIIIGIASVVCVIALGQGSQKKILDGISELGTNSLYILPGREYGDVNSSSIKTLTIDDSEKLAELPYIIGSTPIVPTSSTVKFDNKESNVHVDGVGEQYSLINKIKIKEGSFFKKNDIKSQSQIAIIDNNIKKSLFPNTNKSVIGEIIILGNIPVKITGVFTSDNPEEGTKDLKVYLPYTTVQTRMTGSSSLGAIVVRIKDNMDPMQAEKMVTNFLTRRHGEKDFNIFNTDTIRKTIENTTRALALLVASIAGISLFVGGIGVMNIMLVSVSERINEIGVRMAVGARRSDILQQFLIEAILVCFVGGLLGVGIALCFGAVFSQFSTEFPLIYSTGSVIIALLFSSLIGIGFGFIPASNAAKLDPVAALNRD